MVTTKIINNIHKELPLAEGGSRIFKLTECSLESEGDTEQEHKKVFIIENDVKYELAMSWDWISNLYDVAFDSCGTCGAYQGENCGLDDDQECKY